jgi:hypothetical protein
LPRGFGDRQQMLLNLLRSAANYGGLSTILGELQDLAHSWSAGYAEMALEPIMTPFASEWRSRTSKTADILDEMGHSLNSQS